MGHTVPSQRQVVDDITSKIDQLKDENRDRLHNELVDEVVEDIWKHVNSISYGNTYHTWALCIVSVLLEREKRRRE